MGRGRRWGSIGLLVGLLASGPAACDGPGAGSDSPPTILFGATISITGKTAKEGEYTRDGYQFALDSLNAAGGIRVGGQSYRLALRYYDDESRPDRAAELYEKLIQTDKVNFLLGPYGSAPTTAIAPLAAKYHLPLVSAHGSAGSIYAAGSKYVVGVQTPARNYLRGILDAVLARDPTVQTVAVLNEDDPFSAEVAAGGVAYAQARGLRVVYNDDYPADSADLSPQLAAVKAQMPDIVLGSGHLQDSLRIVKQARGLGLAPKALGFTVGPSAPEFRANLKRDADYVLGATQWTPALHYNGTDLWHTPQAFAAAFQARYPTYKVVPYQVAESAAALLVFQHALEQAGSLDGERVSAALTATDLMTFFGPIRFDAQGVNRDKPMAVEQLQPDGQTYTVFPLEVAEKRLLYPMPDNRGP